jgi:hypothetical protein
MPKIPNDIIDHCIADSPSYRTPPLRVLPKCRVSPYMSKHILWKNCCPSIAKHGGAVSDRNTRRNKGDEGLLTADDPAMVYWAPLAHAESLSDTCFAGIPSAAPSAATPSSTTSEYLNASLQSCDLAAGDFGIDSIYVCESHRIRTV